MKAGLNAPEAHVFHFLIIKHPNKHCKMAYSLSCLDQNGISEFLEVVENFLFLSYFKTTAPAFLVKYGKTKADFMFIFFFN